MKCTIHYILGLTLCLMLLSCNKNQEAEKPLEPVSAIQITKIDSICQSFLEKGNTVGFSVAISHKGETVFSKGYGLANIDSKALATENTIYPIASVSKFITAVATMKMVEENKISLQDKVIDLLPGFPRQKYMDEITIEHLLRHQSGLVDHMHWFDSIYINHSRVFTQAEFFDFVNQPLFFELGTGYAYSNSGYAVLSTILEKISEQAFHDFIIEEIANPLDMKTLGMWQNMWDHSNATMGYELAEEGVDTSFHMMTKGMKGGGGLSASVSDLLKFMKAITKNEFISSASLSQILSPSSIGPFSIDYGFGVKLGNISGQRTWGHSGGYSGTGWAMVSHYPDTEFTFTATNNTNFSPEEAWLFRHKIMPIVLNIDPPKLDESLNKNLDLYVGEYVAFNRFGEEKPSVRTITKVDEILIRDNPDTERPGTAIFPIGDHTFSWEPFPYDEFKFHLINGEVVACSEYADGSFVKYRVKK